MVSHSCEHNMEGIISDELMIDLNNKRVSEDQLEKILSCCGRVDVTFVDVKKIVVKFQNKDHVIRTLRTRLVSYNFNGLWKSLSPKLEILNGDSPIEKLPGDCLMKIFSFLPIMEKLMIERVCRRWREIGLQGWPEMKQLRISSELSKFTPSQLKQIFSRCGRFLKLLVIPVINEETDCLPLVKLHCLQLNQLAVDINFKAFPKLEMYCKNLAEIFGACERLTSVKISGVHSNFNYECLEGLPRDRMRELRLYGPSSEHGTPLHLNLHGFESLEELELKGFVIDEKSLIGLENLRNLTALSLVNSQVHVNHVKKIKEFLKLQQLSLENIISEIDDEDLSEIARNCRDLSSLNINRLDRLTDRCFEQISHLQRLEKLEMMGLTRVTDAAILGLFNLKELRCQDCRRIGNTGFVRLIKWAPNLAKLWVEGPLITEDFLVDVNDAMQYRTSGVRLHLHLHSDAEDWEQPRYLSPLLMLAYTW
ncbi:F-box/LRR-repeat protein 17 isoform X2 [Diachasma alloeum]|uniref:F-box/LRR-repeat protein 17 isoform X2 n=1 Tax=Diachasma alloeum TaxID=454923 RepID=UPI0007384A05|nr:F-box/LRR-repeat protein 17 isoform X2 [Diachasma alloeum]